ncbi:hypothetical protein [Pseudomonas putida]|uniref:hypothetical protein n=1 Tax=Pseudomonas putida TaxID=303 RepID=UPI001F5C283C|nr:hypothetical protein [Pseudomonas putida]
MGSLAELALEHARFRMSGKPVKAPTSKAPKISTPLADAKPRSLEVIVTGPINHFMLLEGRNWAIDLVRSLRGAPVGVVVERLSGAMTGRPGSYAAGVGSVITELQAADVTGRRDSQELARQVE